MIPVPLFLCPIFVSLLFLPIKYLIFLSLSIFLSISFSLFRLSPVPLLSSSPSSLFTFLPLVFYSYNYSLSLYSIHLFFYQFLCLSVSPSLCTGMEGEGCYVSIAFSSFPSFFLSIFFHRSASLFPFIFSL